MLVSAIHILLVLSSAPLSDSLSYQGLEAGSSSSQSLARAPKPRVVFFPSSQASVADCQDIRDNGGDGFNSFAFLSFLLSTINAISVVTNNINNRRNNNNNNNNDNNNNQFSDLESSVGTMQMATKRKRRASATQHLRKGLFSEPELWEAATAAGLSMVAWARARMIAQLPGKARDSSCHARNLCEVAHEARQRLGEVGRTVTEVLSLKLISQLEISREDATHLVETLEGSLTEANVTITCNKLQCQEGLDLWRTMQWIPSLITSSTFSYL